MRDLILPARARSASAPDQLDDEDGVRALYAAHGADLYGFAFQRLGDEGAAEEAVQESFLRAWQSRHRYDSRLGSMRTWLFAIMRNVVIDLVRRQRVRPQAAGIDPMSLDVPDQTTEQVVALWDLQAAMSRLAPHHRKVIVEAVLRDRSRAALAAELGVTEGTVRSRLYYGLRALRKELEEAGRQQ